MNLGRKITYSTVVWQLKMEHNIKAGMAATKGNSSVHVNSHCVGSGALQPEKYYKMPCGAVQLNFSLNSTSACTTVAAN